jgi:hypothetical protein
MSQDDTSYLKDVFNWMSRVGNPADHAHHSIEDLLIFVEFGPEHLGQFHLGLCGFQVRHKHENVLLVVKALDAGTPLVAFVTSQTTTSSIGKFLDLLEQDKLKWQKDRFPWI